MQSVGFNRFGENDNFSADVDLGLCFDGFDAEIACGLAYNVSQRDNRRIILNYSADASGNFPPGNYQFRVGHDSGFVEDAVGTYRFEILFLPSTPPGITVAPQSLTVIEEGEPGRYTVRLATAPSGTVTVTPASDNPDVTVSGALTFMPTDWNQEQTVTVTAGADADAENETAAITHTVSGYGDLTAADPVLVTVIDNDSVGVEVSVTSLTVTEEGSPGSYAVKLRSAPSGAVTVTPLSDNPDVTVSGALTFTPTDWNQEQTVTVTAGADADAENETAAITHTVSGYGDLTAADPVLVAVIDNDSVGVEVSVTSLTVTEEGSPGSYAVKLRSAPSGAVTVTPLSDNPDVTVSGALTFTPTDWDQEQTVTVTAGADADAEDETATIAHTVGGYGDLTVADPVAVEVIDNDSAGVEVSATSLTVTEEGSPGSYAVKLRSAPSGAVTVTPLSDNPDVTVSGALTFTPTDWDQEQTVTVTAGADADAEDETATITHTVSGYGDLTAADPVAVEVIDDDRNVQLSVSSLTIEEGGTGSYTVVLTGNPNGSVTVTPGSNYPYVTVSPPYLNFDSNNWDAPQTVMVSAAPDSNTDDDIATITHSVTGLGNVTDGEAIAVTVQESRPDGTKQEAVEETVRAVAAGSLSNVTSNIGARFSSAGGGGTITLAGRPVLSGEAAAMQAAFDLERLAWPDSAFDGENPGHGRGMSFDEVLSGSAFEISLGAVESGGGLAGRWTMWGRGDMLFFDDDSDRGGRYDGDLRAGYLGVDMWLDNHWLAGLAASRIAVDANYLAAGDAGGGQLEVTLTGVHPYLRYASDGGSELWAILGAGTGEIGDAPQDGVRQTNDLKMVMAAAGARQALGPVMDDIDLALLGDVGFGRLETNSGADLATIGNLSVDTWRARAGVEASHTTALDDGATVTPFLEVTGRVDGGDGREAGVELAGGVLYADPASGIGLEARGRALALYSESAYSEYGASITASLSPGAGGEGLSLALSPRFGAPTGGGATALWSEDRFGLAEHGSARTEGALSLDAEAGYGVALSGWRSVLTPFTALRLAGDNGESARTGLRLAHSDRPDALTFELAGERRSWGTGGVERRVDVIGRLRF